MPYLCFMMFNYILNCYILLLFVIYMIYIMFYFILCLLCIFLPIREHPSSFNDENQLDFVI